MGLFCSTIMQRRRLIILLLKPMQNHVLSSGVLIKYLRLSIIYDNFMGVLLSVENS